MTADLLDLLVPALRKCAQHAAEHPKTTEDAVRIGLVEFEQNRKKVQREERLADLQHKPKHD